MSTSTGVSRRRFFELAGGGVVVLVALGPLTLRAQDARRLYPEDFNAYLVIGENGRVTVFSGKIEMGQGVMTSQAQMVAEELGVALASIDMVLGDTERCPWDMGTFGSLTTRMFGPALRAAAAQARLVLTTLAAERLRVPPDRLVVRDGVVAVAGEPGRAVSYGALSKGARIAKVVDQKAVLRAASAFRVMGGSPLRLDARDKVTGAAKYAADVRVAGMLYARVLRPPAHGAALVGLDASGAEQMPGVVVARGDDLVAVLHADPDTAGAALARLKAQWRAPESKLDQDGIFEHIVARSTDQRELAHRGDVGAARARSARLFETTYQKGYVAHAAIEPHAALAEIRDGRVTVWASTQTPFPTRDRIAKVLGLDPRKVRVITPYLGGGFGGKSADAQAVEAARLAQITGKPVQVAWNRAEEFFYDTFDPAAVVTIVSGLDREGRISLWDYAVYAAGERGATSFYDIANTRVRSAGRTSYGSGAEGERVHPFAVGPWRAPGANMNVFASESQIDIMAAAAGIDPLEFRMRNLADARMRRVLQAAADAFGWKAAAAPSGRGFGIACSIDAGTYVATMAEVKVDAVTGRVSVLRIVCAQDMGIVVNPEGAKMQIEGGLAMGLGYTLAEELRFRGGDILDRNFDTYEIARFSRVPRVEAVLVKNDDLAPQGGGEPSITTTGAVIANATFDASGARVFRLPLTPERVRAAIGQRAALR
ncbi:MAG: molybdopterin cofactor-binding domain-containing protein [Caldimonas sp.]